MLIVAGFVIVILSVLGGFVLSHGKLAALWQPYELLIIGGAAFGAFLAANPTKVVKAALAGIPQLLKARATSARTTSTSCRWCTTCW